MASLSQQSASFDQEESFTVVQQTSAATVVLLRLLTARAGLPGIYDVVINYCAQHVPAVGGKVGLSQLIHAAFTFDGTTYAALGATLLDQQTDGSVTGVALSLAPGVGGVQLNATGIAATVVSHMARVKITGPVY